MPSAHQDARAVTAENKANGIQPLHQGDGNLSVHTGEHGSMTNIHTKECDIIDWITGGCSGDDQVMLHRALLSEIVPGTGTWILEDKEFLAWLDGPNRLLWMHGDLGTGKTMLTCLIIREFELRARTQPIACIYTYFRGTQTRIESIVLDLLKQLLQQQKTDELAKDLSDKYIDWCRHRKYPSLQEYQLLLITLCKSFSQVYLVIDGLDNCIDSNHEKTRELVEALIRSLRGYLKILVTSRSDVLCEDIIKPDATLRVVPRDGDIRLYVESRIDNKLSIRENTNQSETPVLRNEIIERVTDATKGIFLMTKLDMDYLCQQGSLGLVRTALHQLPRSVHTAFATTIQQIKTIDASENMASLRGLAQHTLTWVANSITCVTADQISLSFALRYCQRTFDGAFMVATHQIMSACAGLVTMDPDTRMLRFVHESVKNHLTEHGVIPNKAHKAMAEICLRCLLLDPCPTAESGNTTVSFERSLMEYSAANWIHHIRHGRHETEGHDAESLALELLRDDKKVQRAFEATSDRQTTAYRGMTGLHASVYFGEYRWIDRLSLDALQINGHINAVCSNGQTALHWAAKYGKEHIVGLLIERGADLNLKDNNGDSPLHVALTCTTTDCEGVVKRLVKAGAKLDIRGRRGRTPLAWTIRYGPPSIAVMLARNPEVVNAEDDLGWTSLREAISQGQPEIVYLLLKNGADPNRASTVDDWTPLRAVVQDGDEIMAEHLIQSGAIVDEPDQDEGFTPLRWAMKYNHIHIIQLLLRHGADPNAKSKDGTTPLISALRDMNGNKDFAWILIDNGARTDDQDKNGRTALHHAIRSSYRSIAWLLISHDALVSIQDSSGLTALDFAVENNDLSACWLLCEHGAKPGQRGNQGFTAFQRAAVLGHLKIMQYFLTQDIDIDQSDDLGNTALHHVLLKSKNDVATLLLCHQASLDLQNFKGYTVLHIAVLNQDYDMIRSLLEHGASSHIKDNSGRTPLHRAANAGFEVGLELLIQESVVLDVADDDGATVLHLAAFMGNERAIRSLISRGAKIDAKDNWGQTPLQVAREQGHDHLVAYLRSKILC
ncbi:hypothetical protein FBEOM_3980 [Fusarium beomiforme]|uniref:NACHT domain-containing protein n=1 Tax=Fusarium beomiforme TaxID=44412 RepID=A0A9P5AP13_9HYPO|nr:hypothetical protein FBEOM_3980 [Fusarium beomiforme]